ncbi:MAG: phage virion morphogenesis protein [Desulfobacteraceae bacterium]|nr:phage virion morphogenesis protein [Desulfobacteraceae bacterium]
MAGVGIVIDGEFARLAERLERLAELELGELLDLVGSEVESQTRRRIESEKTDPEGSAWAEWSDNYAATRKGGKKLLENEGDLLDSITFEVGEDELVVGTNLIYGAIHQFGGEEVGIPIEARAYLGLSDENEDDVLALVDDWLDDQLTEAA